MKKYLRDLLKFQLAMFAFAVIPNVLIICFAIFAVTYLPDDICMKAIGLFILVVTVVTFIISRKKF